jgi:hypothetical protein
MIAYPVSAFQKAGASAGITGLFAPFAATPIDTTNTHRINDLGDLDKWGVGDKLKLIIAQGKGDKPKEGDNTRSGWLYDAVCNLRRCGVPREVVYSIITDKAWAISESVLEAGNVETYARKQINDADAEIASEFEVNPKTKKPYNNLRNTKLALTKMGISLSYDLFAHKVMIEGLPEFGPELDDDGVNRLRFKMEELHGVVPDKGNFHDMCKDISLYDKFHPVCDKLDEFQASHDPTKNVLDNWLHVYAGAEDNEYTREVGRLILVALVRRVRQPGCKFDEMPVLETTRQGSDKSSGLRVLAINPDWFTDNFPLGRPTKEAIEQTSGKWIIECPELEGLTENKVENVKAFLSRQEDGARAAYGRIRKDVKRQHCFIGTTNQNQYLFDMTGNRRIWPVSIVEIDKEALARDLAQLWGEAAALEATGFSIRMKKELWAVAAEEQAARLAPHPWVELIGNAIGKRQGVIKASELWALLGIQAKDLKQKHASDLGKAMQALGWTYKQLRFGGHAGEGCYVKGESNNVITFPRQMYNHEADANCPF